MKPNANPSGKIRQINPPDMSDSDTSTQDFPEQPEQHHITSPVSNDPPFHMTPPEFKNVEDTTDDERNMERSYRSIIQITNDTVDKDIPPESNNVEHILDVERNMERSYQSIVQTTNDIVDKNTPPESNNVGHVVDRVVPLTTGHTPDVERNTERNYSSIVQATKDIGDISDQINSSISKSEKHETSSRMNSGRFILSDLLVSDKEVNIWTGVSTLALLEEICLACRNLEVTVYENDFRMHATDRVILTLAKLKQNLTYETLGTLFGISGMTVSRYFSHTIQILRRVLSPFVYWPTKDEILKNIPLCFREQFPNVTIVLDCTEIPVATPKCLNCRISCYSNYKGRRTIKYLIGVTPAGLISFISDAYTGKSSDKFIFNQEEVIKRLVAHRDEVMVDKGVSIQNECLVNHIKLHIPPFMRNERLTADEASRNEAIARARIHVERVIQRVKIFNILTGCISSSTLGHIDDITTTICAIVNLSPPVLADDKF